MKILIDINPSFISEVAGDDGILEPRTVTLKDLFESIIAFTDKEELEHVDRLITDNHSLHVGDDYPFAYPLELHLMDMIVGEVIVFNAKDYNYKQG